MVHGPVRRVVRGPGVSIFGLHPSGSGPVNRDISSYPIKETVKPPLGTFLFDSSVECSKSGDEQYSFASRVALIQCQVQAQQFKFPSTNRAMASSNRLNRPWHVSPARVRLTNQKVRSFGFACAPKNNRMDVNKIQNTAKDVISEVLDKSIVFTRCFHQLYKL